MRCVTSSQLTSHKNTWTEAGDERSSSKTNCCCFSLSKLNFSWNDNFCCNVSLLSRILGWLALSGKVIGALSLWRGLSSVSVSLSLSTIMKVLVLFIENELALRKLFIPHLKISPFLSQDRFSDWKERIPGSGTASPVSGPISASPSGLWSPTWHPEDVLLATFSPWSSRSPKHVSEFPQYRTKKQERLSVAPEYDNIYVEFLM